MLKELFNTLSLLYTNPNVRNHLEKKNPRYAVFSWKETVDNDLSDD